MKGLVRLGQLVLLVLLLASCAAAVPLPDGANKPIEPGDKIGNFLITKGSEGEDIVYLWDQATQAFNEFWLRTYSPTSRKWVKTIALPPFYELTDMVIQPGQPFWYEAKTDLIWVEPRPYDID